MTVVGPLSAEALPAALLPWTLLPLVSRTGRSPRRTAFWAALRDAAAAELLPRPTPVFPGLPQ